MASIQSKRVRAVPNAPLSANDMICVSPPGQNFAVLACVTGKNESGADKFGVCIYGCFATIAEARDWDDTLTKKGLSFQTYIVQTNAPLPMPPPSEEHMDRRYGDEQLNSIMNQWNARATKVDSDMDQRIEQLRKQEIEARQRKLLYERDNVDEPGVSEGIIEFRKTLQGKTDEELLEMAQSHITATKTAVPSVLPEPRCNKAEPRHDDEGKIEADWKKVAGKKGRKARKATPKPFQKGLDQLGKARIDMDNLPKTKEETETFLKDFKAAGGKLVCRMGDAIPCEKQDFKSGTMVPRALLEEKR